MLAKHVRTLPDLVHMLKCRRCVPVVDAPLDKVVASVRPEVLVDARMRKHHQPERQRGLAPLTIGLGPNFEAGSNVDLAIETQWGDDLGRVIRKGSTLDLEGEPQPIDGHSRSRYVYAPIAGIFNTDLNIGDAVTEGRQIARIGDTPIHAPLTGCLRGLTHDGAAVSVRTKIVEVDPRGDASAVYGLGGRQKRIAEGVLAAVNEQPKLY
jgi:xanthine dehydrogenase accessory factor